MNAVVDEARKQNCERVFLATTNDNLHALRFYQKRGFELVAVHRGAVNESRKIKPGIPLIGNDGIPIRDEIELEMNLQVKS
jgi:GNAT superfamily N-acetyltransferase